MRDGPLGPMRPGDEALRRRSVRLPMVADAAPERAMLESAAEQARTSLSDFVRRKALESAEVEVLNRTVVTIPGKDWDAFEAWLRRPAAPVPGLVELARRRSSWDD